MGWIGKLVKPANLGGIGLLLFVIGILFFVMSTSFYINGTILTIIYDIAFIGLGLAIFYFSSAFKKL